MPTVALDRRAFLGLGAAGALGIALPDAEPAALSNQAARALRGAVRGRVLFPRTPGYVEF